MVDTPLILRKLSQLQEFTAQLREYQTVTAGQYAAEWKTQRIIERTLQMAIEVCLDVAGHIISDKGYRIPNSYADTFAVLFENRVIDEKLLSALEKMARCRGHKNAAQVPPGPSCKHLRQIAIDEIAIAKGHRYLTVVLDLEPGAVVFVGDGKGVEALTAVLAAAAAVSGKIEAVAMDMSAAYIRAVAEHLPRARSSSITSM